MARRTRVRKALPVAVPTRRRRRNPRRHYSTRSNPGLSGIVMNGLWVGVGMWAGGMVNGFIGGFTGGIASMLGPLGGIAQGILNAYIVAWIGNRTIGHGELMAAGAFAGTAMSALSGVIGGVSSLAGGLVSSVTGSGASAGTSAAPPQVTSPSVGDKNAQPLRMVS